MTEEINAAAPDHPDLLSSEDFALQFRAILEYWKPRNEWLKKQRDYVEGKNAISAPEGTSFKVEVAHTGLLTAAVNEKASRFLLRPLLAVIPEGFSEPERTKSTNLENALNALFYWMDVKGDGDVWGRMTIDAIPYDMAVERIENISHVRWPDITGLDENGKEMLWSKRGAPGARAYKKLRDDYKKQQGVPYRTVYVPPHCFFPVYYGADLVRSFEIEQQSLAQVLGNKLFAGNAGDIRSVAAGMSTSGAVMKQQVTIVHYVTKQIHAYYALLPASTDSWGKEQKWPDALEATNISVGKPIYLYHYEHNLNRSIYNVMGGRFGSWKTEHSAIEPIMDVLSQLVQDADELASQIKTNIRATYWPTLITFYDSELRDATGAPPAPIKQKEGQSIALWKGEDVKPLFLPSANPMLEWYFTSIMNQIGRLTGSPSLYGQREAGVNTGYHANLQITQSEHLDERLESHFAMAAVQRAIIVLSYIQTLGEPCFVFHQVQDDSGRKAGKYLSIDPKDITPLPELDAKVKRPRPMDFSVSVRTALDASADRHGPGTPLYDDDTILEKIMGEDKPDIIRKKIWMQNEQAKLISSNVLSEKIAERLNLLAVKRSTPPISEEMTGAVDPALLAATQKMNATTAEAAGGGGVSPEVLSALMAGGQAQGVPQTGMGGAPPPPPNAANIATPGPGNTPRNGTGGGLPNGAPQPESAAGRGAQLLTRR